MKPYISNWCGDESLIFVSGQMALDDELHVVGSSVQEQTTQCLTRISTILSEAGLTLADVVKTTVWLARTDDFSNFNRAYARNFPSRAPARSTVRADLMIPGALVEIEAIAVRAKESKAG